MADTVDTGAGGPAPPRPSRRPPAQVVGLVAMAVTVCTWAGFALSTRAIAHSSLAPDDVAVLRYATPALLLAPWWPRAWREVRGADPRAVVVLAVGAGLPFFLLTALGASLSSASHVAVVNPGAAPVWVALLSGVAAPGAARGRPSPGLVAIAVGIAVLAATTPHGGTGVLALLGSAGLWAAFTLAQQRAQLSPPSVVLVVSVPSAVVGTVLVPVGGTGLLHAPAEQVAVFLLTQGVGAGVVSTIAYALAVSGLGARRAAVLGASTPVLVALLSATLFHEPLSPGGLVGLAVVVAGVAVQAVRPDRAAGSRTSSGISGAHRSSASQ